MGFDLFIVTPDPGEDDRVKAAWDAVEAARNIGAPASQVDAAWREFFGAARSYHRFSLGGMHEMACRMDVLGMLTDEAPPPWPEPAAFGIDTADSGATCPDCRAEFLRALGEVQAYGGTDGIPAAKLQTTLGWLVRPDQITAALATYEQQPRQARALITGGDPRWAEWIAFLRRARDHDGLYVR